MPYNLNVSAALHHLAPALASTNFSSPSLEEKVTTNEGLAPISRTSLVKRPNVGSVKAVLSPAGYRRVLVAKLGFRTRAPRLSSTSSSDSCSGSVRPAARRRALFSAASRLRAGLGAGAAPAATW